MTDRELLDSLCGRPEEALAELAERYAPLAAAIAGRVLPGRPQEIEEVASDVLVAIWQAGSALRPESLRGFVITTARNLAIDCWRQLRRRSEVPLFDSDGEDSAFLEQSPLSGLLAEDIRRLDPPDGEIFLRHYLLLEPAAEIGRRFGLTEAAVRARLHRMRKRLQKEVPL